MYVAEALLVKHAKGLLHTLMGRPLVGSLRQVLADDLLELGPRDDRELVVVCSTREGAQRGRWTSQQAKGSPTSSHYW